MITKEKLVTYDDYLSLPDDGNRYEILGGELLMSPSPKTDHQSIVGNLYFLIRQFLIKKNRGKVFIAPLDVVLSMTDVVQPDLVFINQERSQIISEKNIIAAPDLVIEVLSESTETIDRHRKKELYEQYKVKEYWIVDSAKKQVTQFLLKGDEYSNKNIYNQSDTMSSEVITGLSLKLEGVFEKY